MGGGGDTVLLINTPFLRGVGGEWSGQAAREEGGNRWERREEREKTIPGNRLTHSRQDNRRDLAGGQISNTRGRQGETMAVTHNTPCLNRTVGGWDASWEADLQYSFWRPWYIQLLCCLKKKKISNLLLCSKISAHPVRKTLHIHIVNLQLTTFF